MTPADILSQLFESTPDPVFGIDGSGRIRFWNSACEQLFGLGAENAEGEFCHRIVQGVDLAGEPLCRPGCETAVRVARGLPVKHYDMIIRSGGEDPVMINVGAYPTPPAYRRNNDTAGFFVLRKVNCGRLLQRMADEGRTVWHGFGAGVVELTPRELQILELASKGRSTEEIGQQLYISSVTVRNHFKNIYCKLNVHSRAEAISVALRRKLIA